MNITMAEKRLCESDSKKNGVARRSEKIAEDTAFSSERKMSGRSGIEERTALTTTAFESPIFKNGTGRRSDASTPER